MPGSERIKLQGRAAELRQKLRSLDTRAQNHIITIRDLIDPYESTADLEVERAQEAMTSLKIIVEQMREAQQTLSSIDKELG